MKTFQSKKTLIFLLSLSFLFNFLPSPAESNFKPPVLNSTDLAFNGPVNAIVRDEMTGIVYVGGDFTSVSRNTGSGVPIDTITGKQRAKFPEVNDTVFVVISDGSKGWYIGGTFTKVGEIERNNLAAIGTDGTLQNWNPNIDGQVFALVINGSTIYVGGIFSKIGEIKRSNLAAIGTNGSVKRWNPKVGQGSVSALAIKDSTIYIGGDFTNIGEVERNNLAAVSTDGIIQDWNPNVSFDLDVRSNGNDILALAISGSTVYVGGGFDKIGGISVTGGLAAIGPNGALLDWDPMRFRETINAIAVSDHVLYIGGHFTSIDNESRSNFASFSISE